MKTKSLWLFLVVSAVVLAGCNSMPDAMDEHGTMMDEQQSMDQSMDDDMDSMSMMESELLATIDVRSESPTPSRP